MRGPQTTAGDARIFSNAFREAPRVGCGEGTLRRAGAGTTQKEAAGADVAGIFPRISGAR